MNTKTQELYIEKLNWYNELGIREYAKSYLVRDKNLELDNIIQENDKCVWEKLVEVIAEKLYPANFSAVNGLLFLLKDLSWPGAEKGLELLKSFPREKLLPPLENALNEAFLLKDDIWVTNLNLLIRHFNYVQTDFSYINLTDVLKIMVC